MTLPLPLRPQRLVYFGTPEVAVPTLNALVSAGHDVALVVTGADARRGRGSLKTPSPVKAAAVASGLSVTHDPDDVLEVGADIGVVVAYGRLIRDNVLSRLPLVNIHFSLLPRWRGAAPVERALLAGDTETGVCLMDVVAELDAGDVFARSETPIGPDDTLATLRSRLVDAGTGLLLDGLANGFGAPQPQSGEVVYAHKISAHDLQLSFTASAAEARRVIALGGAWTISRGKRLKVWSAGAAPEQPALGQPGELRRSTTSTSPVVCFADGWLELHEVQPEGGRRMDAAAWWNGIKPTVGERLGE